MRARRLVLVLGAVLLLAFAATGAGVLVHRAHEGEETACGPGRDPDAAPDGNHRDADRETRKDDADHRASNPLFAGPTAELDGPCGDRPGHPESFKDLALANSARLTRQVAPGTAIRAGAYRASLADRAALPVTGGDWTPYGNTPLESFHTDYDQTQHSTSEGLGNLSGRATSFARDPQGDLYVAASNGGVWKSANGTSWTSIGDPLPTQVVSGLAYTPAGGGRLVVLTGDNSFGGDTYAGQGAYWTDDDGASWHHATGIQDGLLGFKLAVDPTDGSKVYAATGGGLFRSTDGGASFTNVDLPTGDCAGKPTTAKDCFLANVVTDVVVQGADNGRSGEQPGAVLAAVGWRAGTKANADGAPQSPHNGMYGSPTGAPGSFTDLDFAHNANGGADPMDSQNRIGRIALGIANGPQQDHGVVYALVQDAVKFNGGVSGLDVNETGGTSSAAQSDYLNALYVSSDFGRTWTALEGSSAIDSDTTSNSALAPPTCKTPAVIGYCPGIQAWYNLWVEPDPTQATAAGVPTRLAFGLEEVWAGHDANGFGGSATVPDGEKFDVVGRYFAGQTCTLLNVTNGLPVCPIASGGQVPAYTTHPDQHGALWVPDASGGGVTLYAANDGGVYRQHVADGDQLTNTGWGQDDAANHRSGVNAGLHTLQPYDAEMAKDGTVYMGLQDNGEGKIDPDGTSYTIYGGDGFFTAVDPDHSDTAYEEYTGGDLSVTTDGGKNWTDIQPSNLTSAQFATPLQMDPNDANHLMIGGRDVEETGSGPATTSSSWSKVYDLGTREHPGDAAAQSSSSDPDNQLSAVDTLTYPAGSGAPTGPKTADSSYSGGATTIPGGGDPTGTGTFVPGTYDDHPFTIGANDGDAAVDVKITWADANNDWDLYLYRNEGGTLKQVGSSANGGTTAEEVRLPNPPAGDYVVRAVNFAATGTYDASIAFTQRTSSTTNGAASYVAYCGYCDTITQGTPFGNGLATNVGGSAPGQVGSSDGWHIARAAGLPKRYITSVRMDPANPRTVYVTLAGYGRRWAFPGALGEDTGQVGTGHVFKSTDAGETFTDITGDLPDTPADWSLVHDGHLVVGTDIGVFESCDAAGGAYSVLGRGLPTTPVSTMRLKPGDPDTMVVATYGRGVYTYRFGSDTGRCPAAPGSPSAGPGGTTSSPGGGATCPATTAFRHVKVTPRGRGLHFAITRRLKRPFTLVVTRRSTARRVISREAARVRGKTGSFTWTPRRALGPGLYATRLEMRGVPSDRRRATFARSGTRFRTRGAFHAPAGCGPLSSARLTGPAIGGVHHAPLRIDLRPPRGTRFTVVARNGGRVVQRWSRTQTGTRLTRLTVPASRLRPGDVRVDLTAGSHRLRLVARRLPG